ncbi:GNAT family N-acetyltransferase [Micromonospora sp. WMMA1923]|uniref:GNAT family N-acetyltransferase n=1 Tax=Micromonospora sp. WMMA1923 TaxID=3404125 RepID=UPI003B962181
MTGQLDQKAWTARPDDVPTITMLLTAVALFDPVAEWLVPDRQQRRTVLHRLIGVQVDHAVARGDVTILGHMTAIAVWHPYPHTTPWTTPHQHDLGPAAGRAAVRFQQLLQTVDSYRSAAAHDWLSWLWVRPTHRGRGLGRHLLDHRHHTVDQHTHPIDTVVTTTGARDALTACGYHPDTPLHLPGGPRLWPLRRNGRPPTAHHQSTTPAS